MSSLFHRLGDGKISIDYVHGISIPSGAAFVSHPESGRLAYTAGCTIVIVDSELKNQSHIINFSKNEIVSLAFTPDGNFIAAGESGHVPAVRIWHVATKLEYAVLTGHKFSVPFLAFSPDRKYLVSIGNQNDQSIILWDVEKREKLYPAQIASKINGLAFSPDSSHFITVGVRFAKFWYIRKNLRDGSIYLKGVGPLEGTSAKMFTSVAYVNSTYIVASTIKSLCQIKLSDGKFKYKFLSAFTDFPCRWRFMEPTEKTFDDVKMIFAILLDAGREKLFVACSNGLVKIVSPETFDELQNTTPFYPHELGVDVITKPNSFDEKDETISEAACARARYGDAIAMTWLGCSLLATVYSNHSIYCWNVENLERVELVAFSSWHSKSVVDVDVYPVVDRSVALLPANTFATCSGSTIRFWSSQTLLKVIYCDVNDRKALCDRRVEQNLRKHNENEARDLGSGSSRPSTAPTVNWTSQGPQFSLSSASSKQQPEWSANTLVFRPDGRELAVGFNNGFLRVYNLNDFSVFNESHQDSKEILVLSYSRLRKASHLPQLLAIAGDDFQTITVLNATDNYATSYIFRSGHATFINSLSFAQSEADCMTRTFWLISTSQDKLVVFHEAMFVSADSNAEFRNLISFSLKRSVSIHPSSPHDLLINEAQDTIALACHDRRVRLIDIQSGRIKCSYLGADVNSKINHQLKRLDCHTKGLIAATVCSDKTISLVAKPWEAVLERTQNDWTQHRRPGTSEKILAVTTGHGSSINSIKFLPAQSSLVTVSVDSCVFLWKFDFNLAIPTRSITKRSRSTDPAFRIDHNVNRSFLLSPKLVRSTYSPKLNAVPKQSLTRSVSVQQSKLRPQSATGSFRTPLLSKRQASADTTTILEQHGNADNVIADESKLRQAVENLETNTDIICDSFGSLIELAPEKRDVLFATVKDAARKLDELLREKEVKEEQNKTTSS